MKDFRKVIFYTVEKAIKTYRQFAQQKFREAGLRITVDQWLTLNCINQNPKISQTLIAAIIFKDAASITRILNLLIRNGYVKKETNRSDKRKSLLLITTKGKTLIARAETIVTAYRTNALAGLSSEEISLTQKTMQTIINNLSQ